MVGVSVTWRLASLVAASAGLVGVYAYTLGQAPWALALAAALMGLALASYLYGKAVWNALQGLEVKRRIEGSLVEGLEARVILEARNLAHVPLLAITLEDTPPRLFRPLEEPRAILFLAPGGSASFEYRVIPMSGRHSFGEVRLRASDPLGLVEAEAVIAGVERESVRVAPRVAYTRVLQRLRAAMPYAGSSARSAGWGTAFYYLRDYVEGDDVRKIDWKALARTGKLMVKQFEAEEAVHVALVLLVSGDMLYGPYGDTMFEESLRLAAALSAFYLAQGDLVDLVVYDGSGSPRLARRLWGRNSILSALRVISDTPPEAPEDPAPYIEFLERRLPALLYPGGYYVVLITSLNDVVASLSSPGALRGFWSVARGGVVLHVYKPLYSPEALGSILDRVRVVEKALREAEALRRALRSHGMTYALVGPKTNLPVLLTRLSTHGRRL